MAGDTTATVAAAADVDTAEMVATGDAAAANAPPEDLAMVAALAAALAAATTTVGVVLKMPCG